MFLLSYLWATREISTGRAVAYEVFLLYALGAISLLISLVMLAMTSCIIINDHEIALSILGIRWRSIRWCTVASFYKLSFTNAQTGRLETAFNIVPRKQKSHSSGEVKADFGVVLEQRIKK